MRLIDADALNEQINASYPMTDRTDVHNGYAICQELIKSLPTITLMRGRWIAVDEAEDAFDCSECDAMVSKRLNYCPHCGAKMDA